MKGAKPAMTATPGSRTAGEPAPAATPWRGGWPLLQRELLSAWRRPGDILEPVVFFVLVSLFFPLAMGTDTELLRTIAPGAIWIAALLAAMLSLTRLFRADADSGFLEQLLIAPLPLPLAVLIKVVAHWAMVGLPMVLCAPLLAVPLGLESALLPSLLATLALGTPVLFLLGAVIEALVLGARGAAMLLGLLLLPLQVPVMVFGATALLAQRAGYAITPHLSLLGGILLLALLLAPFAAASALRIALD